jgi:hypothetical protein
MRSLIPGQRLSITGFLPTQPGPLGAVCRYYRSCVSKPIRLSKITA